MKWRTGLVAGILMLGLSLSGVLREEEAEACEFPNYCEKCRNFGNEYFFIAFCFPSGIGEHCGAWITAAMPAVAPGGPAAMGRDRGKSCRSALVKRKRCEVHCSP
jgi:hypothetical protein